MTKTTKVLIINMPIKDKILAILIFLVYLVCLLSAHFDIPSGTTNHIPNTLILWVVLGAILIAMTTYVGISHYKDDEE